MSEFERFAAGEIVHVGTLTDPRLAPYRNVRDRDLWRSEQFLVEGEIALRIALGGECRFEVESVLLTSNHLQLARELMAKQVPDGARVRRPLRVFLLPQPLMNELCGFDIHRGILACARRTADLSPARALADAKLVCCIFGVSNHDNVGGIFRSARAFGADAVLVDDASCDPLYRKAVRVSSGAVLTLPFVRGPQAELLAALAQSGFEAVALVPHADAQLQSRTPGARTALLLGAEGSGLDEHARAACKNYRIAMQPGFDSLNVAAAASIALYELTRDAYGQSG